MEEFGPDSASLLASRSLPGLGDVGSQSAGGERQRGHAAGGRLARRPSGEMNQHNRLILLSVWNEDQSWFLNQIGAEWIWPNEEPRPCSRCSK